MQRATLLCALQVNGICKPIDVGHVASMCRRRSCKKLELTRVCGDFQLVGIFQQLVNLALVKLHGTSNGFTVLWFRRRFRGDLQHLRCCTVFRNQAKDFLDPLITFAKRQRRRPPRKINHSGRIECRSRKWYSMNIGYPATTMTMTITMKMTTTMTTMMMTATATCPTSRSVTN